MIPVKILGETIKKTFQEAKRLHETHGDHKSFLVYACCHYLCPETGKLSHSYFPYLYGETFLDWKGKDIRSIYDKYKNTINDMAAGKAKDLVAATKRNKH